MIAARIDLPNVAFDTNADIPQTIEYIPFTPSL
jgi:hypothetical protein